jgi:multidrug efflux pump subunit AcrB
LRSLYVALQAALDKLPDASSLLLIPPPIQGIGNASGFTMRVELRDGAFDYAKLERLTRSIVAAGSTQSALTIVGTSGQGFSSGEAIDVMEQIADRTLPTGTGYEWTAMSYQEKQVGNQIVYVYVFGFGLLLVYLCLAGQYESWIAPLSVLLAVPLLLIGPAAALAGLGLANNL